LQPDTGKQVERGVASDIIPNYETIKDLKVQEPTKSEDNEE
jgi:hypothetical protein